MLPFDESKLTAYALGELSESERAEVEREIVNNAEARAFIAETRAFADVLSGEFKQLAPEQPSPSQRDLLNPPSPAPIAATNSDSKNTLQFWRMVSLVAAALLISSTIYFVSLQKPALQGSPNVAKLDPPTDLPGSNPARAFGITNYGLSDGVEVRDNLSTLSIERNTTNFPKNADLLTKNLENFAVIEGYHKENVNLVQSPQDSTTPNTYYVRPAGATALSSNTSEAKKGRAQQEPMVKKLHQLLDKSKEGSYRGPGDSVASSGESRLLYLQIPGNKNRLSDGTRTAGAKYPSQDLSDDSFSVDSMSTFAQGVETPLSRMREQVNNNESYQSIPENPFLAPTQAPLSTFSIDVDTASYSNMRRFLTQNTLPPRDSVRIEELVNYFTYSYASPNGNKPFNVHMEVAACPWNLQNKLVRVALKAKEIANNERKNTNLVFLVDVSGSMSDPNKLALAKEGLRLLTQQLGENDQVSIVTYAGSCGVALPSTNASHQKEILAVIDGLHSGGSTNGASGIQLAYDQAVSRFIKDGVNRVILMTDGDFNVGITDSAQLNQLITEKAKSGVFLSVLGFGMGNLKDAMMEQLADKGNGNYAYIDTLREARKVLVDQMNGTLVTVAKDVKLQIEFNPAKVAGYRLIGYENRVLAAEDFNNDKKDAGEIGAGHTVTALYEIAPAGSAVDSLQMQTVDPLKYQKARESEKPASVQFTNSEELLTVKIRYKQPDKDVSELLEFPLADSNKNYSSASEDYKFAAAVASFGMLLRNSQFKGTSNWNAVLELAEESKGTDTFGYRREFIDLVMKAKSLAPQPEGNVNILQK